MECARATFIAGKITNVNATEIGNRLLSELAGAGCFCIEKQDTNIV